MSTQRAVGRSVNRVEGREKVTGAAVYTADQEVPDVAYAVLVQAEVPHGQVTVESLRAGNRLAANAPGVCCVLTPLNCPPLQAPPRDMSYDLPLERRPPLSDLTVQHVGQHMAVIVADTFENAAYAASLVELDYVTAPAVLVARDVLKGSPAPDEDDGRIRHGAYRPDHFVKLTEEKLQDHRGARDEPTGTKVTADFTTPVHAHYPIELAATIAAWDGDELTIHDTPAGSPVSAGHSPLIWTCPRRRSGFSHRWSVGPSGRRAFCGCTWPSARWPRARQAARSSWC